MKIVAALLLALTISACAIGNQHQYAGVVPNVTAQTNLPLAIGVQDRRLYILDGTKTEDFVGVQRGGFGNPFDVTTTTEGPLAIDIRASVAASFRNKGVQVTTIDLKPGLALSAVAQALVQTGKERAADHAE